MKKIWIKYFITELVKVFILVIFCFYFLYVLIDYSIHTKSFQNAHISILNIALYYVCQFTKRLDILIPLALMIATIKVLTTANMRNEIVALTTGGISLKKIMYPFLCTAFFCIGILYLNFEFLQPLSLQRITSFEECYFKNRGNEHIKKQVNAILLEDNSLLLFQNYDQKQKAFFDVFWLKNKGDQFYRIQSLLPYEKIPLGKYVDSFMRTSQGEIIKCASFDELSFPEIKFNTDILLNAVHPPRMQSITKIMRHLDWKHCLGLNKMSDREAESVTFLYYKLTAPLICLLAVIGPAPFCLLFSRNLPIFSIYAISLCGMITLYTFINSSVILGESQVLPPMLAVLIPQATFFLILGWKYAKFQ